LPLSVIPTQQEWKYLMPKDTITRAAGYLRISGEDQSLFSLDLQEKKIRQWCMEQNVSFSDDMLFCDEKSGKYWRNRKGLNALLESAKRKEVDVLVLYRRDRLARSFEHQIILSELFQFYGVKIVTLDPTEPKGDTLFEKVAQQLVMAFSEVELGKITERCQDGLHDRYESGYLPVGRRPLYGYSWQDGEVERKGKMEIVPKASYILNETVFWDKDGNAWTEWRVVIFIFESIDAGLPLRRISLLLSQKGIPSPDGKVEWWHQTVRDIAKNPAYISRVYANKRKYTAQEGGSIHWEYRPEEEWVALPPSICPPLISEEVYIRVQERLSTNKKYSPRNNPNINESLLRCGHAICAYCGTNAGIERNHTRNTAYYICPRAKRGHHQCIGIAVRVDTADSEAWKRTVEILRDPSLVEQEIAKRQSADPTTDQIESAKEGMRKLAPMIQNIMETIGMTLAGEATRLLTLRLEELGSKHSLFQEEIDRLTRQRAKWSEAQQKIAQFKAWCDRHREELDDPDFEAPYEKKVEALAYLGIRAILYRIDHTPPIDIEVSPPEIMSAFGSAS